jgi:predicted AlkP superfamily pyrophosphatase or phosphodiesterase
MRYILTCFLTLSVCGFAYSKTASPIVILLSIDGFSYGYLNKHQPSNILALGKSGVTAKLQPVYPSKTFPNHLSIITGSYPINHGISNNTFYSPTLDEKYSLGAGKNNSAWLTADPFWTVVEQQGLKSAVYFWPESEAKGKQPTYNIPFNKTDSNEARFTQIIKWLKLPSDQRPNFIASYFSTVDEIGHYYGPNSSELRKAVADMDLLVGEFTSKLTEEVPYAVNLIIVSDHGMLERDRSKTVKPSMIFDESILELIKNKSITVAQNDTQLYIYFSKSKLHRIEPLKIIEKITNSQSKSNLFCLYAKGKYPKHWQLDKNIELVPDIILEALPPATFVKENYRFKSSSYGTHGYDAMNNKDLMGIFIASGPDIVKGKEIEPFENIHVVPFMSSILTIKQPKNIDGKYKVLAPYLNNN